MSTRAEECGKEQKGKQSRDVFCHKKLTERIEESGVPLTSIGEYDWGEPQGNEAWMESIYGDRLPALQEVLGALRDAIEDIRHQLEQAAGMDPVEHCLGRIKSEESMREKCRRKGLPETAESALERIYDAIGLRVVCPFLDDVYAIRDRILELPGAEVIEEKDYIRHAKPNGYRSYHMIIRYRGCYAEIQLRTISMDTWAALEHHIRYKKDIHANLELITSELKRCADELASTDVSLQTIRDMIQGE